MHFQASWVLAALLLQAYLAQSIFLKGGSLSRQDELTCAPLSNLELYSAVKVSIGDPAQTFDLVADTGSDSCIVKDCACEKCPSEWGSCFNGQKLSRSFKLPTFKAEETEGDTDGPASMVMSFGSGDISTQVASDQIQLGAVKTYMENGVLLMVDHTINLKGHFEGILGLGRPQIKTEETQETEEEKSKIQVPGFLESAGVRRFSMCFNHHADGTLGLRTPPQENMLSNSGRVHWSLNLHEVSIGKQDLKVDICSSSKCSVIPDSGTTLLSGPEEQISSIYEALCINWPRCRETHSRLRAEVKRLSKEGVEVEGTSEKKLSLVDLVGSDPQEVLDIFSNIIASTNSGGVEFAGEGYEGALPGEFDKAGFASDAARMGSEGQSVDSAGQSDFEMPTDLTLQLLLEHCEQWIRDVDINEEMPDLSFMVSGANGNQQQLRISPRNYVLAKYMDVEVPRIRNVFGFKLNTKSIERRKVCTMAFTPTDYSTLSDGQIWIMGTPLFYEYTAHYDRGTGLEDEVAMAFTRQDEEECGRCDGDTIVRSQALIAEDAVGGKTRVGLESLNFLSDSPVVRNLTGVQFI